MSLCGKAYAGALRVDPCDRQAGHVGFCQFPSRVRRHSEETRLRMVATRLQTTVEVVRAQTEAGNRWCSNRGHGWIAVERFGPHIRRGLNTICLDCDRENARRSSARRYREHKEMAS